MRTGPRTCVNTVKSFLSLRRQEGMCSRGGLLSAIHNVGLCCFACLPSKFSDDGLSAQDQMAGSALRLYSHSR